MCRVHSAAITACADQSVIFVRYNPDAYSVESQRKCDSSSTRQEMLCMLLRRLLRDIHPSGALEVHYLFYSAAFANSRYPFVCRGWPTAALACVA